MAIPDRDETSEEATCWSPNIACRGDQRAHSRTFNTRIVDDVLEIEGKRYCDIFLFGTLKKFNR